MPITYWLATLIAITLVRFYLIPAVSRNTRPILICISAVAGIITSTFIIDGNPITGFLALAGLAYVFAIFYRLVANTMDRLLRNDTPLPQKAYIPDSPDEIRW